MRREIDGHTAGPASRLSYTERRAEMIPGAASGTASDRARPRRRGFISLLLSGAIVSGCMMQTGGPLMADEAAAEPTFEQYDVATGPAKHQTVLTGFLLGGAVADLAVVSTGDDEGRRLRIYGFDDAGWAPRLDAALRPEVQFVDVAGIGGRDRLITYEDGRLNWFDPASATERALVAVTSNFNPPPGGVIPQIDVTRDLNGDGRDDLVVPDYEGIWVCIQMRDGAFADPVRIGPSNERARIEGPDGHRYDLRAPGRIHQMDYDRDGRTDLVFWNEDHFEVHLQVERGLFAAVATTFTTDVAFDSDDLASLAAPHGVRRRLMDRQPPGALTGRVLHSLTDMNGDGVADLVVFSLEGGSLWRMHSTYEVHFGAPAPDGGIAFAQEVGAAIESDGIPFGMEQHDFDRDGRVDVVYTTINPGFFKAIGMLFSAMLNDSVALDLQFYRMEESGYPGKPDADRTIRTISFGRSGEQAAVFPSVLIGDVNGDGRSDLLLQKGRKELRVFFGVPGPDLFDRRPRKVAVSMPKEEYTRLVDLNGDGRDDVLMHQPSTTEPHRVTMLIAR